MIGGLSGSGKSHLTSYILEQFLNEQFREIIISDKSKVDFKNSAMEKIDPLVEPEALKKFIAEMGETLAKTKRKVEASPHSHSRFLSEQNKIVIVVDELHCEILLATTNPLKKADWNLVPKMYYRKYF
ncbi:MAG: hypothetical protein IPM97_02475 [Bdellovibrionaceae bacterium]|nr:hypothetical protein [Pseudobdellovibrionaceae bacterium]